VTVLDRLAAEQVPSLILVELLRVRIPLRTPFRAAHGEVNERDVILVRVVDESGSEGWGECPTLSYAGYTSEHTSGAWRALREEVLPSWVRGVRPAASQHPMAASAVEVAVVDAGLRAEGVALHRALGGAPRPIPTTAVVGMAAVVGMVVDRCRSHAAEGHGGVKVKIGPGWDLEPLLAVRRALPELDLAADANGSYPSEADVPHELGDVGLSYLEQPLPPDDLAGTARLRRRLGVPVALDESIPSAQALAAAVAQHAVDVVNVKIARLGGLLEARAVLEEARSRGVDAFVGGMLETGIGRAAALAVATHPASTTATDLGPSSRYFVQDVTEPFELDTGGCLTPPAGPGIGVTPHPDVLHRFVVDRATMAP
jgi:o-succinylbenzoate synthase